MRATCPRFVAAVLSTCLAGDTVTLDFAREKLPEGWRITSKAWHVVDGELKGNGDGALEWAGPLVGDFKLSFSGWSAEKANFEVKLFALDEGGKAGPELYTFAFLGRYHSVLGGVKCCILREQHFVANDPKMWIFPGRRFTFELRAKGGQFEMLLDGEIGPVFVDPQPLLPQKGVKLTLLAATEGSKDEVRIDDVRVITGNGR